MTHAISGLVVILGSPNDVHGNLSEMGRGRVALGHSRYLELCDQSFKILLTGGFGEHFNVTDKPNAHYAREILLACGVPREDIVEFAESRNTVDDALQARPIVDHYGVNRLVVVSSDFHMERVKFVFSKVFPDKQLEFSGATFLETRSPEEQKRLLDHESRELTSLRERGESIVGGSLKLDSWKTKPREIPRR